MTEWMKLYLSTGNSSAKTINYKYKLHYIKKLLSLNAVAYRALLISRLNDLRDWAHLAS